MNKSNQTKTHKIKSKYKVNVNGGGILYANSIVEMIFKIFRKKYEKNENPYLGRRKKPTRISTVD